MNTVTFESCSHLSITYDPFWDLSLPIPRRVRREGKEIKGNIDSIFYRSIRLLLRMAVWDFPRHWILPLQIVLNCSRNRKRWMETTVRLENYVSIKILSIFNYFFF